MPGTRGALTGWVKMPKSIMDSPVFEKDRAFKVYAWCRMRANPTPKDIGGNHLQRGQFLTSTSKGATELNMSPSAFDRWIREIESEKLIKRSPGNNGTIITVVDYDVSGNQRQNGGMQSGKQSQRSAGRKVGTEEEVLLRNTKKVEEEVRSADAPVPSEPDDEPDPPGWEEWFREEKV